MPTRKEARPAQLPTTWAEVQRIDKLRIRNLLASHGLPDTPQAMKSPNDRKRIIAVLANELQRMLDIMEHMHDRSTLREWAHRAKPIGLLLRLVFGYTDRLLVKQLDAVRERISALQGTAASRAASR